MVGDPWCCWGWLRIVPGVVAGPWVCWKLLGPQDGWGWLGGWLGISGLVGECRGLLRAAVATEGCRRTPWAGCGVLALLAESWGALQGTTALTAAPPLRMTTARTTRRPRTWVSPGDPHGPPRRPRPPRGGRRPQPSRRNSMVEGAALGGADLYGSFPMMLVTIEWRLECPRVARGRWRTEAPLSLVGWWGLPLGVPRSLRALPDSSSKGPMSRRIPQTPGTLKNRPPRARER